MNQAKSGSRSKHARKQTGASSHAPNAGAAAVIAQLTNRMEKMEQAFNHNTKMFISTMQMLEVQNQAQRQVISDLCADLDRFNVETVEGATLRSKDGKIDWQYYLETFLRKMHEQAKAAEAPAPSSPAPVLASPGDGKPLVFGGDVG